MWQRNDAFGMFIQKASSIWGKREKPDIEPNSSINKNCKFLINKFTLELETHTFKNYYFISKYYLILIVTICYTLKPAMTEVVTKEKKKICFWQVSLLADIKL